MSVIYIYIYIENSLANTWIRILFTCGEDDFFCAGKQQMFLNNCLKYPEFIQLPQKLHNENRQTREIKSGQWETRVDKSSLTSTHQWNPLPN